MELELGLALSNASQFDPNNNGTTAVSCGKRGFAEAFGKTTTLSLFAPGDDDGNGGDGGRECEMSSKRKRLVGWPPVKGVHRRSGSYVKVKMEGVAIGRKVDLSIHGSYEELRTTLDHMFPTTNHKQDEHGGREDDHHHCVVTYEDGDGDWMLVGDVPWDAFARSVKRLKILG